MELFSGSRVTVCSVGLAGEVIEHVAPVSVLAFVGVNTAWENIGLINIIRGSGETSVHLIVNAASTHLDLEGALVTPGVVP